jgi:hypothetical protein
MPDCGLPKFQLIPLSATGAVREAPGVVVGIEIADVANDCTVALDDSTAGGGTTLLTITSAAEQGGKFRDYTKTGGIIFATGIYATITSAGTPWVGVWIA